MLTSLCQELHNWFVRGKYPGTYEISGSTLTLPFLQPGQYYRIIGSVFNDGVKKYGYDSLTDETFEGSIWAMAVDPEVIKLSEEIDAWVKRYGEAQNSPYTSESFGGYSYSKGVASGGQGGATWQSVFHSRLNKWRKI